MVKINGKALNFAEIVKVYIRNAFFYEAPVILCVGSDKVAGDSLAPLVGTLLKELFNTDVFVYGTLKKPVHAGNLKEIYEEIKKNHEGKKVLCIDACLGRAQDVGFFKFSTEGLLPGKSVNKELGAFGDYSILAIVDEAAFGAGSIFRVRMGRVWEMASSLSGALAASLIR